MSKKILVIFFLAVVGFMFAGVSMALEFKKQDINEATKQCQDASPCKPELVPTKDEEGNFNLALLEVAKPKADSLIAGWCPQRHCTEYLNDGFYNNCRSWISATSPGKEAWAEIDMGNVYPIKKVGFGSDHCGNYKDRAAKDFEILVAKDYNADTKSASWKVVYESKGVDQITNTTYFEFSEVEARYVRISVTSTSGSEIRIDEMEIYSGALAVTPKDGVTTCWGKIKTSY
ncbi:MAG: hypothetical protein QG641_500 [Candidatus Poribacteria bacterium]|nr:hypothetical protein [Candidatus Poribacteria bacterium]